MNKTLHICAVYRPYLYGGRRFLDLPSAGARQARPGWFAISLPAPGPGNVPGTGQRSEEAA
jgi:hypothetical protein